MANYSDDVIFADEDEEDAIQPAASDVWKILVVDDEAEIHSVTRLVLRDHVFMDKHLEFISAYSGEEARKRLAQHPDTAVILLDVVMEHEHAGLEVARYIREELKNPFIRIVLRTGQPGQAPETKVIVDYDINDYKEKSELTAQKLYTLLYSTLRAYRDVMAIEANRKGLEDIIEASARLFREQHSEIRFVSETLDQLRNFLPAIRGGLVVKRQSDRWHVLGGIGEYAETFNLAAVRGTEQRDNAQDGADWLETAFDPPIYQRIASCFRSRAGAFENDHCAVYFRSSGGIENILYLDYGIPPTGHCLQLAKVLLANLEIAFDNLYLNRDLEESQQEMIYLLGDAVETRSKETGSHVKRVAELSKFLALRSGIGEEEAEAIKMASPMHDVGKIGIPDAILNKPDRLTPEEWETMKAHTRIGYDLLKKSKRQVMRLAAQIAYEHHEKWDGSGYPRGLSGTDISLAGRITAVADVFDALSHRRCYKQAWTMQDTVSFMREQSGRHFDPNLIEILLGNIDVAQQILDAYPD